MGVWEILPGGFMPEFDVVLFDMDGTLVEHNGLVPDAISAVLVDVDCHLELDLQALSGNTDYQNFKMFLKECGCPEAERDARAAELCDRLVEKMSEMLLDRSFDACPGVAALLPYLAERAVPLGLLTGNLEGLVGPKLAAAGISPEYFVFGGFGDACENRTEVANLAMRRAEKCLDKKLDPQRVLIIGDTPKDVACARAMGAKVLTVTTGVFGKEELMACEPDYMLESLADTTAVMAIVTGRTN
jgi:phosphoglycolate phosphatase